MRTTSRLLSTTPILLLFVFGAPSRAAAQPTITACPAVPTGGIPGVGLVDSLPLAATGGSGSYTWTLAGGTLPPGLSIRTDVPPSFTDPAVTAVIAGVATTPGTYPFTLRVTSGVASGDLACSLTVSSLVFKDPVSIHDAFVNQSYSHTLTALRNGVQVFPTWSVSPQTPLPSGIALNPATGELSGTPASGSAGFYSVVLLATEGGDTVSRSVALQVFDLTITTPDQLPNATERLPYSTALAATGGTPPYTFAASGLPAGLSLDGSGVISGTPIVRGPFTVTVTVTDSAARSYVKRMSVDVVTVPPLLPSITPGATGFDDCTIGVPCSRAVFVVGGGRAPYSWSASGLPPGMSIRNGSAVDVTPGISPKDAELWGTIVAAPGTVFNITVTVTDADNFTATNTFPLRVSDLALSNVSTTDWTVGVADQQRLRVLGGTSLPAPFGAAPDGTNYGAAILSGAPPAGIGLGVSAGCASAVDFCGTPVENIATGARLRFMQGASQLDRTYGFNVTGGGSTIAIGTPGDLGTFPTGMTYSKSLTACCTPNALSWSVVSGSLPSGLALSSSGVLSGTTVAGLTGTFTFLVKAADAIVPSNVGLKQFTMRIVSNALTTSTILPAGKVGTLYNLSLTTLAGGGAWSLNQYNYLPPGLVLGSGGLFGTPTATGQYTFTATNSNGPITATFTLTIYPATYNPPAFGIGNPVQGFGSVTLQLIASGGSGGYQYSWSPGADPIPGLRIQNGPPLPTGFPGTVTAGLLGVVTEPGVWLTSIRVTDSSGNFLDRPFTFTVQPIDIVSQLSPPKARWGQPYSFQLEAFGGTGYAWSISNAVNGSYCGLTISAAGVLSGTPDNTIAPCSANTIALQPSILLKAGPYSLTTSLSITADPFSITTAGRLPDATAGVLYSQAFASECVGCTWSPGTASGFVSSGGSGYAIGDILTISGGTRSASAAFRVTGIGAGGVVQAVVAVNAGNYTTAPTNPAATTGGSGTGCTITFTWSPATFPQGLTFNAVSGTLSGTPSATTTNAIFTLTSNQASPAAMVSKQFSMRVVSASPQTLSISSPTGQNPATNYFTLGVGVQSAQLLASGGVPPYQWSIVSGSLPPGMSLSESTGETLGAFLAPGVQYIVGKPMQTGVYTFTLQVADHGGVGPDVSVSTRTLTWVVTELSAVYNRLPPPNGTIPAGSPFTTNNRLLVIGGSATEGTGDYTWANLSPLPYGLTLDSSTGVIGGTPIEAVANTTYPIQATDNVSGATLIFNVALTVTGSPISIGLSSSLGTFPQGNTINNSLNITGGTQPYTVTGIGLPSWLTINSGSGLFAGQSGFFLTGVALQPGTFTFGITVSDSTGQQTARTFTLAVAGIALTVSPTLPPGSVGEPYDYKLSTFNTGVTWAIAQGSSLPPGLTLAQIGGVAHIVGTPTVASTSYSFSLTATDAFGATFTSPYSVTIADARILDPQILPAVAIVGSPFSYQFTANCPGANPCVTWSAAGVPAGYVFTSSGVLQTLDTVPSAGTFSINVTAAPIGGGVAETRRFTFFSRWPNPLLLDSLGTAQLVDATVGQPTNQALNASGGVPPYSWSVAPGHSLPPGLTLTDWTSAGSPIPTTTGQGASIGITPGVWTVSGLPTTAGLYTFDLILEDSVHAQVRRTFTLRVTPIGILQGAVKVAVLNAPYSQQFMPIGNTGPASFTASPVNGFADLLPPGLTLSPDGLLSGTPTSTGSYAFFLTVAQGGSTFTRRTTVNVARAADTNSARNLLIANTNPIDLPVGVGRRSAPFTLAVSTANASNNNLLPTNPENYRWTLALRPGEAFPPGMLLIDENSIFYEGATALAGQPTEAGTYVFTIRATDKAASGPTVGDFAEHTFTLKVAPMQMVSPPTEAFVAPDLPSGRVGVPYSTRLRMAGGTPPYHYTVSSLTPLPAGLTVSDDGVLSGTPQTTFSGNVFFIITDSSGNAGANMLRPGLFLQIAPAGTSPHPLIFQTQALEFLVAARGVPYSFPLDAILRGGTAPFTWSVAAGSLPPGIVLFPGSNNANNVSAYLGGVPQEIGQRFEFTLKATDSATPPQEISIDMSMDVYPIALTPDTLVPGTVGVPYSAQITASGGTGPYQMAVYPFLDFPPGLTLEPNGLLHGTPTAAGNFAAAVLAGGATDDDFGATVYRFAIDKPGAGDEGEAPAVSLPTPIQITYTQGSGSIAPVPIDVNATSARFPGGGDIPFGASIVGIPGAGITPASVPTGTQLPGTVNLTLDHTVLDGLNVAHPVSYDGILAVRTGTPNQADGAANLLDQMHVKLTVLPQPPCAPSVSPGSATIPATGGSGSFTINAAQGCAWTAVPTAPWITLQSQPSGSGSATVNFTVAPNPDPPTLAATIDVQYGQSQHVSFGVTQFGSACAFDISPKSVSATAAGGTAIVNITASSSQCTWPASDPAVALPPAPQQRGNGSVTVTIAPTGSAVGLSYDVTVAGRPFHVTQAGVGCSVSLNPGSVEVAAAGGTDTLSVTTAAGCGYSTLVGPAWVNVSSGGSGTGSGTLVYSVEANAATTERSGTLTIGGAPFTVHQLPAACSVTLDTSRLGSPYGNGAAQSAGVIGVMTNGNNCPWSATSDAPWARLSQYSGTSGVDLRITLDANTAVVPRSATLTVAGQALNITQSGTQCTFGLQSSDGSVPSGGGLGTVGVIAPAACTWNATASTIESPTWLHILGQGSAGTSNVLFSADANPPGLPLRTGTISVAGNVLVGEPPVLTTVTRIYTITQGPAPCSPTLAASGATVSASEHLNQTIGFSSPNGCTPPALSYADWISDVQVSGTNVLYSVQANPAALTRSGSIQVGDKTFTVTQQAAACAYRLSTYGSVFGQAGGTVSLSAGVNNTSCPVPVRGTVQSFITFTSPPLPGTWPPGGQLPLDAAVAAYQSLTVNVRFGAITFGNQIHSVKQTSW